jgi:hypothetical protein
MFTSTVVGCSFAQEPKAMYYGFNGFFLLCDHKGW